LEGQMDEKKVALSISPEARTWLARNGYDEKMGARPMERLIQEKIKRRLAEELLFGTLSEGGRVEIDVADNELTFDMRDARVH
jgi:ATP-dependent Clp protease ATP-binding subunit ClpA